MVLVDLIAWKDSFPIDFVFSHKNTVHI